MKKTDNSKECVLILHNIRSVHNVGSIFRTADAAGITKIYVTGYTPAPIDRFGRERRDFVKVSLGAEKTVLWEKNENPLVVIDELKKKGVFLVAVEQAGKAIDYKKVVLPRQSAIIFGNEVEGISENILHAVDVIAEIPMHGEKESLNVSVSVGIALFRMRGI